MLKLTVYLSYLKKEKKKREKKRISKETRKEKKKSERKVRRMEGVIRQLVIVVCIVLNACAYCLTVRHVSFQISSLKNLQNFCKSRTIWHETGESVTNIYFPISIKIHLPFINAACDV